MIKHLYRSVIIGCSLSICACTSQQQLSFVDSNWSFSFKTGNVINSDSTMQFYLGGVSMSDDMTFISCLDSLRTYNGAERYLSKVLSICGLSGAEILFFIPAAQTLWVELPGNYTDCKPRAISYNLTDSRPGTLWVWDDYAHEGGRKPDEIYSNSYVNKKSGTLMIVDKLDYGEKPMACIHIYQSDNKKTQRMGFNPWHWTNKGSMTDMSCIDMLSNWIDGRRDVVFKNYLLGQEMKHRHETNRIREELMKILELDQEPRTRLMTAWREQPSDTSLHKRIGKEIWQNDSVNRIRVLEILDSYDLEFGEENEVVWAVIQHSSLEIQKKYLPKFIAAAQKGDLKGEFVAVMQDRIAIQSGKPQIYGSQGNCDSTGRFVPAEIENPEDVNIRRAAMGMIPLEEYISHMSRK